MIVGHNTGNAGTAQVNLTNLPAPPTSLSFFFSTSTQNFVTGSTVALSAGSGSVSLPADSIFTLVGTSSPVPSVSITSPTAGQNISPAPANVSLAANATAPSGRTITSVSYASGGSAIAGCTGLTVTPYTCTWSNVHVGNYSLTASATDNTGAVGTSSSVAISVGSPPVVLVGDTNIEAGSDSDSAGLAEAFQFTASATGTASVLNLYLDAADAARTVKVGVYSDANGNPGTLLSSGTVSNAVVGAWNAATIGAVSISAGTKYWIAVLSPYGGGTVRFRDRSSGNLSQTSSSKSLSGLPTTWSTGKRWADSSISAYVVTSGSGGGGTTSDTTPPVVSVSSPSSGATVSGTINVSANASDNVGVTSVQFTLDGANLGAALTAAPYTVAWDTTGASNGAHTLGALAKDAAGNTASASIGVTVSNTTTTPSVFFGDTTIETTDDSTGAGAMDAYQYTSTAAGTVGTLDVYVPTSNAAATLLVGIYSDSADVPGSLLASCTIGTVTLGAWNHCTLSSGLTVPSVGTAYWIAVMSPAGGAAQTLRVNTGNGKNCWSTASTLTSLPASFGALTCGPGMSSLYASP